MRKFFVILSLIFLASVWRIGYGRPLRTYSTLGMPTCGSWSSAIEQASRSDDDIAAVMKKIRQQSWLIGYATGVNAYFPSDEDALRDIDADTLIDWTSTYCASNPKKDVIDAVDALLKKLGRPK